MQTVGGDLQTVLSIVQIIAASLAFVGIFIASLQVRAARRVSRANVLLRLIEEWNSPEVYAAVKYIHDLRRQWKESPPQEWMVLAENWVGEHVSVGPKLDAPLERKKSEEWKMRRIVSQFISKLGYMMLKGYIKPEDFFGVVPETRRLLAVLEPIELSIAKYYRELEAPLAEWDQPFDKLVFESLKSKYDNWFITDGSHHIARMRNA